MTAKAECCSDEHLLCFDSSTTVVSVTDTASGSSSATRSRVPAPTKPARTPSLPVFLQQPTPPASPALGSTREPRFTRRSLAVIDERTSPLPDERNKQLPPPPLSAYARIFARFRRHASADHVPAPATAAPPENKRPQPVAGPSSATIKPRKTLKKRSSQHIRPTPDQPPAPAARPKSPPPPPAPIRVPTPAPVPPPARRGRSSTSAQPTPNMHQSHSPPPTRQNIKSWLKQFKLAQGVSFKRESDTVPHTVFGIPLRESLHYASVQISTAGPNRELYVWGYIPVVVAKCGLFLKENATEVEGVFRISGSSRRMRDLQNLFESPPRYGKDLNWKNELYTPHDVASVFRRYLTQMPEPVIPTEQYHNFRSALSKPPRDTAEIIRTYRRLIREMPRANQYLLLYVLDLLSVFARKAEKNLMTESNLAVIFRPGIISHPAHEMQPHEHALSQEVLVFLIQHQDHFMIEPPARTDSLMVPNPDPRTPTPEKVYIVPSDSDEDPPEHGWKLVEQKDVNPAAVLARRRSLNSPTPEPPLTAESGSTATSVGSGLGGARVKRSRTMPTHRPTAEPGEAKAKRKGKRLDTVGSVGSTAEATAALAKPAKDREKAKDSDGSRHTQTPSAAESSAAKEKASS